MRSRMPETYKTLNLPPLTDEQMAELEALKNMKEEDIDVDDIPECRFNDLHHYYVQPYIPHSL